MHSTFEKFQQKICSYIANFIELQLIITLSSLPILICWGLPVSGMFLISNLIFTPLLILFLWLSTIFACCIILHLPCTWIASSIDYVSYFWLWLLSFSKPSWLFGFSMQMLAPSCMILLLIFVFYSRYKPTIQQSLGFLICCLTFLCFIRFLLKTPTYKQLPDLPIIVLHAHDKNYLIDCGGLCKKQNFYNHLDYTIIPELIKQTGLTNIDTLILCKPSKRLPKIALQCAKQLNISTIIAPEKFDCLKTLKLACKNGNIKILPLKKSKFKS